MFLSAQVVKEICLLGVSRSIALFDVPLGRVAPLPSASYRPSADVCLHSIYMMCIAFVYLWLLPF